MMLRKTVEQSPHVRLRSASLGTFGPCINKDDALRSKRKMEQGISTPVYKYVSPFCGINEGRLSTAPYKDARSKCQHICKDVLYDHNILGLSGRQAGVLNNMAMCESPLSACLLMRRRGFIHILIPRICGEDKKRNGGISAIRITRAAWPPCRLYGLPYALDLVISVCIEPSSSGIGWIRRDCDCLSSEEPLPGIDR